MQVNGPPGSGFSGLELRVWGSRRADMGSYVGIPLTDTRTNSLKLPQAGSRKSYCDTYRIEFGVSGRGVCRFFQKLIPSPIRLLTESGAE